MDIPWDLDDSVWQLFVIPKKKNQLWQSFFGVLQYPKMSKTLDHQRLVIGKRELRISPDLDNNIL